MVPCDSHGTMMKMHGQTTLIQRNLAGFQEERDLIVKRSAKSVGKATKIMKVFCGN